MWHRTIDPEESESYQEGRLHKIKHLDRKTFLLHKESR
jgi:hypothetical protein